jgi:hypothetical protein
MSTSFKADLVPAAAAGQVESSGPSPAPHRPYYLVIDHRFRVPIFVLLEEDPRTTWSDADLFPPVLDVMLELVTAPAAVPVRGGAGVRSDAAIGRDPHSLERFREFRSDRHARAAGFVLIEPRYVGPNWESYIGVFHPEGGRPLPLPHRRPLSPGGLQSIAAR